MFNKNDFIKRDEVVFCDECGALLKKEYSFDVKEFNYYSLITKKDSIKTLNFCSVHKKPYKLVKNFCSIPLSSKYFNDVEVDQNGKPIK